ncbi:MAG: hypothetical protein VKM92_06625 [Cyanobacteriota bacterium]|nr:hypothetical protein [Cyanobacteriota bacterium]
MAPEVSAASGLRRLADQLQTLTELTESLTYRLLELEEAVAGLDQQLQSLQRSQAADAGLLAEGTELRLDDTEDRLSRLEALLGGLERLPQVPPLSLLARDALPNVGHGDPEGRFLDPEPHFPDEDLEQSFLDEQPAFLLDTAAADDHQDHQDRLSA